MSWHINLDNYQPDIDYSKGMELFLEHLVNSKGMTLSAKDAFRYISSDGFFEINYFIDDIYLTAYYTTDNDVEDSFREDSFISYSDITETLFSHWDKYSTNQSLNNFYYQEIVSLFSKIELKKNKII